MRCCCKERSTGAAAAAGGRWGAFGTQAPSGKGAAPFGTLSERAGTLVVAACRGLALSAAFGRVVA